MGGGQLAQMMTQAAVSLSVETVIFERFADSPAGRLTPHEIVGQWTDEARLREFAALSDVVTLESEFVDANILRRLESWGVPVLPNAATVARVQDKLVQKQAMAQAGLRLPAFAGVDSPTDVLAFASQYGWPLVLKARRDGYDGYGNATLTGPDDVETAWNGLKGDLLVEAWVPFERELAVMVVRGRDGEMQTYPVVETVQKDHICHIVRTPAPAASDAAEIAVRAVEAINGVGVFGVEMFALADGEILYNEIAPRPHNSGHYTIEACVASQFENHIRAVLGWPLAPVAMRTPAAVMVNILGERQGDADYTAPLPADGHVHLYGKRQVRVGRKMGHVTVLADTVAEAEAQAAAIVEQIKL